MFFLISDTFLRRCSFFLLLFVILLYNLESKQAGPPPYPSANHGYAPAFAPVSAYGCESVPGSAHDFVMLLCVPLMLQSSGYLTGPLTPLETLSWGLWAISLGWEHLADSQKLNFARFPETRRSIFGSDGRMKNALIMK